MSANQLTTYADRELLLDKQEVATMLPAFDENLLFVLERRFLDLLDAKRQELALNTAVEGFDSDQHLRMFAIEEVAHEGTAGTGLHLSNMQNVLTSLTGGNHNVLMVVTGDRKKTALYYGLARIMGKPSSFSTHEYATIFARSLHGNFFGVKSRMLSGREQFERVLTRLAGGNNPNTYVAALTGIPSLRTDDTSAPYAQGLDRFLEAMRGEDYVLAVIAEPIDLPTVDAMMTNCFNLGSEIHSCVRATIQKAKSTTTTFTVGGFGAQTSTTARTIGASFNLGAIAKLATAGVATVFPALAPAVPVVGAALSGINAMLSFTKATSDTLGGFGSAGRSYTSSRSVTQETLNKMAEYCEELCQSYVDRLKAGKSMGFWNVGVYIITHDIHTHLRASGLLKAILSGGETHWEPIRTTELDREAINRYLLNVNNPRYNLLLYGVETREIEEGLTLEKQFKMYAKKLGKSVVEYVRAFQTYKPEEQECELERIRRMPANVTEEEKDNAWKRIRTVNMGHPLGAVMGGVATPLNTLELSVLMNLPRKEVQGLTVRKSAEFGANYPADTYDGAVSVGNLIHKREVQREHFHLRASDLQRHTFICGITGSGKTNTCMQVLAQLSVPFLVIEPTKASYRNLRRTQDCLVFTLGLETVAPFRLNPFECEPGFPLLKHIDYLRCVFTAAFPMYASMPYLLEQAIVDVYVERGWDLATSRNRYVTSADQDVSDYIPTLRDLHGKIDAIVAAHRYAQQLTQDLSAALKARLASLLTGSKGLMLNTRRSIPMPELLNQNVVLELSHMGDDEEKAFIMGLLIAKLHEYRELQGTSHGALRHLTVLEEAHRLLKRVPEVVSPEVANVRGKAVETFSNMLAEIREYGEGIIVVDQIPAKLSPDVIKNTSNKVVHRLLARDDRDLVGDTMGMTDDQKNELPFLRVGQAVVHRDDLDKTFLVQVTPYRSDDARETSSDEIRQAMLPWYQRHPELRANVRGIERIAGATDYSGSVDLNKLANDGVAAARALLMVCVADEVEAVQRTWQRASKTWRFSVGSDDTAAVWLAAMVSVDALIRELGAFHSGKWKDLLDAHKAFIEMLAALVLNAAQIADVQRALISAFMRLCGSEVCYDYFARCTIDHSEICAALRRELRPASVQHNWKMVDAIMEKEVLRTSLGVVLTDAAMRKLKRAFLSYVLIANPNRAWYLEQYEHMVRQ